MKDITSEAKFQLFMYQFCVHFICEGNHFISVRRAIWSEGLDERLELLQILLAESEEMAKYAFDFIRKHVQFERKRKRACKSDVVSIRRAWMKRKGEIETRGCNDLVSFACFSGLQEILREMKRVYQQERLTRDFDKDH